MSVFLYGSGREIRIYDFPLECKDKGSHNKGLPKKLERKFVLAFILCDPRARDIGIDQ